MLQPLVRRTWAPSGETPIQKSWDRHDRLSVITAISRAPKIRRMGLYFKIYSENIDGEKVFDFLRSTYRTLQNEMILIMDRWSVHRKANRLLEEYFEGRETPISVEWLPAYAPDLNPVEHVWNHTKYGELANYLPEDIEALEGSVQNSLGTKKKKPEMLKSCFHWAGLPP